MISCMNFGSSGESNVQPLENEEDDVEILKTSMVNEPFAEVVTEIIPRGGVNRCRANLLGK